MDQAGLAGADHAQRQGGQRHRSAAVERQVFHLFGGDRLAGGRVFGIELRGIGGHLHGLRDLADIQADVDHRMVARAHVHALADEFLEPLHLSGDIVIAGQKERRGVLAAGIGERFIPGAGVSFGDGDFGSGDRTRRSGR